MPKPTKRQKVIANIYKNVYTKKKWECIIDNCNEQAINSHLLQQNGILDNISEKGHLIELKPTDIFSWTKKNSAPFRMKLIGIKRAFSIPVFCDNHDTTIFKEIETHPIDLDSYKTQLLLSYRVVCAEIRKKETNIEFYNRMLNAETLKGEGGLEEIKISLQGNELGIKDLVRYKNLIEAEINKPEENFTFKLYKYPLIKIYGSAVFSPIDYTITDIEQVEPLNSVFIHVIPYDETLHVIVGYNNDFIDDWIIEYTNSWTGLEEVEFKQKLTNLFAAFIENWGISPELNRKIKKENLESLEEYTAKNANNLSPTQTTDFNLFE